MDEITLDVHTREQVGTSKVRALRRENLVPGVVYGGAKKDPTKIKVDRRAYEKIMRHHKGQSVVFHLSVIEGDKKLRDYSAIVKEEQHDPLSFELLHLDFQRISLTQEIEVKIQIEVRGEAIGVKRDKGSVDHVMWEMDIVCLPTNIPERIEVNVDELEIGDSIHVKDLNLPVGVKTNHDPEGMVLSIVPPAKEEEEVSDAEEPEVIGEDGEKKESEEGGDDAKAEEAPKEDSGSEEEKKEG